MKNHSSQKGFRNLAIWFCCCLPWFMPGLYGHYKSEPGWIGIAQI